jgi:ABC-2 type transport system ATP-binding protein
VHIPFCVATSRQLNFIADERDFVNAVELNSVCKKYDNFVAVDHLSVAIPAGKVFGLLGPNGAGKTSTLRMMIGIIIPDAGTISVLGEPFHRAHTEHIGYLPEERGLYRKMKVLDHLIFFGELKGLPGGEAKRRALRWCERLELSAWIEKKVEELSKGMQQKVQFIGALLHEPELLILDEPFSGLDPSNAIVLKDVLLDLKKAGKTLLLSTHRMDQAERMCDSICLINHGRALLNGDLREIKSSFGMRNVQIKYDGDSSFLQERRLVQSFNDFGNYVEVRLAQDADPQDLLHLASAGARLSRFELMEPSLEEIFLDAVGKSNA